MRNKAKHDGVAANAGCYEMRGTDDHIPMWRPYSGSKSVELHNKDYPPQIGGNHYDKYQIKPIAALKDWLSEEEYRGYLRGNAIKYQIRYRDKGGAEDLQKAKWYLNELIALEATNGIATHT